MAAFVQSTGLGIGLERGSDAAAIGSAAVEVLGEFVYRSRAAEVAELFVGLDSALSGAAAVESLLL